MLASPPSEELLKSNSLKASLDHITFKTLFKQLNNSQHGDK